MRSHQNIPAVIYARYSTDKQDSRSTEDQVRRCRRHAELEGYDVVGVYEDKAVSGAHAVRADLQRMLGDARRRGGSPFRAVLVDDQSRLARDLGTAWRLIFEDLPSVKVKVVDCTTGRSSDEMGARLTFGVTALMNDSFLEMVRTETHRGMEGRALTGFATGGRTFGYDTRKEANPSDPEHPRSEIFINADEAALVRRIFRMWIEGQSFKSIAITLNDERIPAPHDGGNGHKGNRGWVPSTIRAMLLNDRYIGKVTWNKSTWMKDRTTGRRRNLPNAPEKWITLDRPDLRIIEDDDFAAAQARFKSRKAGPGRPAGSHSKRHSLCAGLLRCGACSGSMTIVGQRRKNGKTYRQYGCTSHYTRGATICSNKLTVSEGKACDGMLLEVRRVLGKPGIEDELVALYSERLATAQKADDEDIMGKHVAAADRKLRNLYDAVGKLGLTDTLDASIRSAEADLVALRVQAAKATPKAKVIAHPARIKAAIRSILETLEKDTPAARELLRRHIGALVLTPTPEGYIFDGGFLLKLGSREDPATPAEASSAGVSGYRSSGGRICQTSRHRGLYTLVILWGLVDSRSAHGLSPLPSLVILFPVSSQPFRGLVGRIFQFYFHPPSKAAVSLPDQRLCLPFAQADYLLSVAAFRLSPSRYDIGAREARIDSRSNQGDGIIHSHRQRSGRRTESIPQHRKLYREPSVVEVLRVNPPASVIYDPDSSSGGFAVLSCSVLGLVAGTFTSASPSVEV